MDAELLELQKQLEYVQQAKSSVRLSERNVVELVQKLHELRFLDFDLLHTTSGKEYITPDQLRLEMETEVKKLDRVSLIDLSDITGVDLFHIERLAQSIVADDPDLMLINGEIISQSYWDSAAEEINEKLQECSQIALAEIAAQLQVGSELVLSVLVPRLGTVIKGRLEGGQLYTPAYVSRISAMVRGAARGITVPTNLATLWSSLQQQLQEMNVSSGFSVESSFFQSLFTELVKEGDILGSLRAGVQWTPDVFAHAQRESVDSFYSQNSFISYDVLHKLAIPQPKNYLKSRYPEGIALDSIFIHPSMVEMMDAAIEDAIENGNWIDCLAVLPVNFGAHDASKLLSCSHYVQAAVKSSKAVVLGESYVFSVVFIKGMFEKLEKELENLSHTNLMSQAPPSDLLPSKDLKGAVSPQNPQLTDRGGDIDSERQISQKGSKKKKGKVTGFTKATSSESVLHENPPSKGKKNPRKSGSVHVADTRSVAKKNADKAKEDNTPSEEWVIEKILALHPDIEEQGETSDNSEALPKYLCSHLRPLLLESWKKRRNTILMENAERRRKLLENLQKRLDEDFLDLQLYEKALELFDDDPPTSNILHKHLLRGSAASIVDNFLVNLDTENKLICGINVEDCPHSESRSLSSGERLSIAKELPGSLSAKAQAIVEALEGKKLDAFMVALREIAEESGINLKKLDKKLERALLHSYRKDLVLQVASESDPVALLPKVVALLYLQVYNKALQAPGRAISAALSRLKDKLPGSTFDLVMEYHEATVGLLALQSAAVGDEDDCSYDRILTKRELLESIMSELKGLVLDSSKHRDTREPNF